MNRHHFVRRHPKLLSVGVLALIPTAVGAYFLASGLGSGSGHYNTGGASTFAYTVTVSDPTVGSASQPLTPGSGTEQVPVSVSDTTGQAQHLSAASVTITADGAGDIFDTVSAATAPGCKASWFTADLSWGGSPLAFPFPVPTSGAGFTAEVAMPTNASTDQSACENLSPQITVNVS